MSELEYISAELSKLKKKKKKDFRKGISPRDLQNNVKYIMHN